MKKARTIGLDLAKNVFQVHGADEAGGVVFRVKLRRDKLLAFFAEHPPRVVAMEACASAHHWAREIAKLGHQTRMIAAHYVKPFVKRQKNDAVDADAEAICESALRPSMRFVRVKTEEEQASAVVFRARDLLVRQRTQMINALPGHLTEYGIVAPSGAAHVARVVALAADPTLSIPDAARTCLAMLVEQLQATVKKIATLDREIAVRARRDERARRLMTIPGIGPVRAVAIAALYACGSFVETISQKKSPRVPAGSLQFIQPLYLNLKRTPTENTDCVFSMSSVPGKSWLSSEISSVWR